MKLKTPKNRNYCGVVVKVKTLVPLDGSDNLVGIPFAGFQAIVGKDTQVGDMGIMFTAETQLSLDYTSQNNLHRHSELNSSLDAKGYLEDSRRIRVVRLRCHRSDALFMPLSSLLFTGGDVVSLGEGDEFDEFNGVEICCKYEVVQLTQPVSTQRKRAVSSVRTRYFPEHFDSENFFKVRERLNPLAHVVVTQKLHGTSLRVGHVTVTRRLSWGEKLVRKLGIHMQEYTWAYVYGSRKVVKDVNDPTQQHFYGEDIYTEEGRKLDGLIPQGYVVYGELIGWASPTGPIQKHYTYGVPQGERRLYVYRVVHINQQGFGCDLSWDAVKEFCTTLGLKPVVELWQGTLQELNPLMFLDRRLYDDGFSQAVPLASESLCDEGVCIRIEGITPQIYKAKSPMFLAHETKMLDKGEVDVESQISQL